MLAKAAPSIRNAPATAVYGVSRSGRGIERIDGHGMPGGSPAGGLAGSGNRSRSRGGWGELDPNGEHAAGGVGSGTRGTGGYGLPGGSPGTGTLGGNTLLGGSPGPAGPRPPEAGLPGASGNPASSAAGSPLGGPSLGAPGAVYGAGPGGNGGPNATASRGTGTGTGTGSGRGAGSGDSTGGNGQYARGDGTARHAGQEPGNGSGGRNGSQSNTGNGNGGSSQYASGSSSGSGGDGSPFGGSAGGGSPGAAGAAGGPSSMASEAALSEANASPNMSMVSRSETMPESLVGKRGADWGLPQKGPNATGLTRPIQVYCSNDRIIVFTERGGDKPILVEGRTEAAVDELVDDVWEQVRSWGAPGRNMYWKPQLTMHVAPDGARRFDELKALLDGSGLDVVGKPIVLATPTVTDRQPRR
jgi:hypothetical protein